MILNILLFIQMMVLRLHTLGDVIDIREDISSQRSDEKNSNRVIAVTAEAYLRSS